MLGKLRQHVLRGLGLVAQRNGLGDRGMHSVGAFRFSPPGARQARPPSPALLTPSPARGIPAARTRPG